MISSKPDMLWMNLRKEKFYQKMFLIQINFDYFFTKMQKQKNLCFDCKCTCKYIMLLYYHACELI